MIFDVLSKAIPFALLPILTRYLTPAEYGVVAMFGIFQSLLAPLVGLNTAGGITVFFFRMEKDAFRAYVGSVFFILLGTSLLVLVVALLFSEPLGRLFELSDPWVLLAITAATGQFITLVNLTLWQVEENPRAFGFYQLSQTITNVLFALFLVVAMDAGVDGRLWSIVIPALIFGVLSLWIIVARGYVRFKWQPAMLKRALRFGIPLLPHALSSIAKSSADRFFITSFVGLQATGLYSVAWQFGNIVFLVAFSFNKAFGPYLFKLLKQGDEAAKYRIVRYTYVYFIAIFAFALLLGFVSREMIPVLLGERFAEVGYFVLWIAVAFSFDGMYFMVVNYIFYQNRTDLLVPITTAGALLHILLSYWFIWRWGAIGAALAQIVSGLTVFLSVWYVSSRVYKMPWFETGKV